jgi:hypothetical protein
VIIALLCALWPVAPGAWLQQRAATAASTAARRALVREFVQTRMHFSDRDWRNVLAGHAVARQMTVVDGQDVNVFGVVRVKGQASRVLDQVRQIDAFERSMGVIGVGRFSQPPRPEDLRELKFTRDDLADLPGCRQGNCELQFSASAISQLRQGVDWRRPDATEAANAIFRQVLFNELRLYRADGIDALSPYADRGTPTHLAPEIRKVTDVADVPVVLPALFRFLLEYPRASLTGVEEFFYWNTGEFGMKPTTRLNHVVVYPITDAAMTSRGVRGVAVTRQLYSSHYFSATTEWRTVIDDDGPEQACFLLYTTRSRVTGLSGIIGTLIRSRVRSRARSGMERYLSRTRNVIETGKAGIGDLVN